MAIANDTTSTTINGKDGTADFSITPSGSSSGLSYKCILDAWDVMENIEMTNADVFCLEGTSDQEPGRSQLSFNISGLLKKNGPASGPLIPAPQNASLVFTASSGCTISMTANFTQAGVTRVANQNGRISARGVSKGTYSVVWDTTP